MKEYLPKMKGALYRGAAAERAGTGRARGAASEDARVVGERGERHTYVLRAAGAYGQSSRAIGPNAMLCAAQAVILETDATKARTAAREYMKTYVPRLPNYTNNLKALGWADKEFENGCSRSAGRCDRRVGQ